jgi:hypothetical protein
MKVSAALSRKVSFKSLKPMRNNFFIVNSVNDGGR